MTKIIFKSMLNCRCKEKQIRYSQVSRLWGATVVTRHTRNMHRYYTIDFMRNKL